MEQKKLNIDYVEYLDRSELGESDRLLVEKASEVARNSYAPYSEFNVGAAVLLDNGEIVTGSNQENAAFPSGLCAERVAIFYANSKYPAAKIVALSVTALQAVEPVYPCGACRQVIAESEKRGGVPIRIIIDGNSVVQVMEGSRSLLPFTFDDIPQGQRI